MHRIADGLSDRISGQGTLIEDSEKVRAYNEHLSSAMRKDTSDESVFQNRNQDYTLWR